MESKPLDFTGLKIPRDYQQRKEEKMDDLVEKIKKAEKVIGALTQLTLSIGTLLAVIKMVLESLM